MASLRVLIRAVVAHRPASSRSLESCSGDQATLAKQKDTEGLGTPNPQKNELDCFASKTSLNPCEGQ